MFVKGKGTKILLYLLGSLFVAFVYTQTAFLRYGPDKSEYHRALHLQSNGDVEGLNHLLIKSKSISTKLVMMSFIEGFGHESSIAPLAKTLAFDLPWWDRFDGNLDWDPAEIRFSAHLVLAGYEPERAGPVVYSLLEDRRDFVRLYGAGVILRWGDPVGERILDEYINSSSKRLSQEATWVKSDAFRHRQTDSP